MVSSVFEEERHPLVVQRPMIGVVKEATSRRDGGLDLDNLDALAADDTGAATIRSAVLSDGSRGDSAGQSDDEYVFGVRLKDKEMQPLSMLNRLKKKEKP